ncbi:MAG: hypothetical protein J6C95_06785 [Muribaculaceae bacterium]|nr:hypothetical protein [Muribaculaceae bacterium]
MSHNNTTGRGSTQLWCAVAMCAVGAGLLIAGFIVDPTGAIHSSVLVAFGETMTFAGALFGIDYKYKR